MFGFFSFYILPDTKVINLFVWGEINNTVVYGTSIWTSKFRLNLLNEIMVTWSLKIIWFLHTSPLRDWTHNHQEIINILTNSITYLLLLNHPGHNYLVQFQGLPPHSYQAAPSISHKKEKGRGQSLVTHPQKETSYGEELFLAPPTRSFKSPCNIPDFMLHPSSREVTYPVWLKGS